MFWRGLRISDSTEYMDRGVSHRINLILKEYYTLIEDWEGVLRQVDVWNQCAKFHDIGKHYCIDYVSNSSRNLTDEEFRVIKDHPDNFDRFFAKSSGPIFDCIRACARFHHVWYNGKGGYPATAESTPNKPFVDILSIADSIQQLIHVERKHLNYQVYSVIKHPQN